jgi:hypothetical protein
MFPPYHDRQEPVELVSVGGEPLICRWPWRKEYIPLGELVPAWQPVQLPIVPAAKYAV